MRERSSLRSCRRGARLAAPVQIYGNSRGENDEAEDAVRGIRDDGAGDDGSAGQDEKCRCERVTRDAIELCVCIDRGSFVTPTKDEKRSGGQRERDKVDRNDVVENLLV